MLPDGDPKKHSRIVEGRIPADEAATPEMIGAAEAFAAAAELSETDGARLRIVVEEIFANAVKHGRPAAGSFVSYRFEKLGDEVRIGMADSGAPFDPRRMAATWPAARSAPDREGGQGWPLIASWCRIAGYRREAARNRLLLIMPLVGTAA